MYLLINLTIYEYKRFTIIIITKKHVIVFSILYFIFYNSQYIVLVSREIFRIFDESVNELYD